MTNVTMLNNISSMKYSLKSVLALLMLGSSMGMGWPQDPTQMSEEVMKKFQMTNFTMLNNISSMKYSLKSVPGLADVGVLHGDGDGPVTPALGSGSKKHTHHADLDQ